MRLATGFAHGGNFVIKRGPVLCQHMLAGNDDVDFVGTLLNRIGDFCKAQWQRCQACRKTCCHRGYGNAGAFQCFDCMGYHGRINTDCAGGYACIEKAEGFQNIITHRTARFSAKSAHTPGSVVTSKCGKVDALDCTDEPCCLIFFLDRTTCRQRRSATFRGAAVHDNIFKPFRLERRAIIAGKGFGHCIVRL